MQGFNQITLAGNLVREPELREVKVGDDTLPVTDFTLAVNEKRGGTENTTFVRCSAWRQKAEAIHTYLKKGSPLIVTGKLKIDTKKVEIEGEEKNISYPSVNVLDFTFVPENKGDGGSDEASSEDIPF